MILTLSVAHVTVNNNELMKSFGGRRGLRDRAAFESAAARPEMTFDGEDLYPDLAAKAAALMHSLVVNHAFLDGNKRAGAAAAELFVDVNGYRLNAADPDLERVTFALARGELSAEALAIWFRQRLRSADL